LASTSNPSLTFASKLKLATHQETRLERLEAWSTFFCYTVLYIHRCEIQHNTIAIMVYLPGTRLGAFRAYFFGFFICTSGFLFGYDTGIVGTFFSYPLSHK
jgi:hypothetical protein